MALTDKLTAIADAIRAKTGGTTPLTLAQMPTEIAAIQAGGGGIGAVKFIDVDITVEASTTTAVSYAVDGLEFVSSVESPTKWTAFSHNDAYLFFVTPKEITGEASGNTTNIYNSSMVVAKGNTNYTQTVASIISYGTADITANNVGIYGVKLSCSAVTDGKPTGALIAYVKQGTASYEVVAGVYNIQVYHLTSFDWGYPS